MFYYKKKQKQKTKTPKKQDISSIISHISVKNLKNETILIEVEKKKKKA